MVSRNSFLQASLLDKNINLTPLVIISIKGDPNILQIQYGKFTHNQCLLSTSLWPDLRNKYYPYLFLRRAFKELVLDVCRVDMQLIQSSNKISQSYGIPNFFTSIFQCSWSFSSSSLYYILLFLRQSPYFYIKDHVPLDLMIPCTKILIIIDILNGYDYIPYFQINCILPERFIHFLNNIKSFHD